MWKGAVLPLLFLIPPFFLLGCTRRKRWQSRKQKEATPPPGPKRRKVEEKVKVEEAEEKAEETQAPTTAPLAGDVKMPEPLDVMEDQQRPIGSCPLPEPEAIAENIPLDTTQQETPETPPEVPLVDGSDLTEEERKARRRGRKRTLKPVPRTKKKSASEHSDETQLSLTPEKISVLPTATLAQAPTKGVLRTSSSVELQSTETLTEDEDVSQTSVGTASRRSVRFAEGTILDEDESQPTL